MKKFVQTTEPVVFHSLETSDDDDYSFEGVQMGAGVICTVGWATETEIILRPIEYPTWYAPVPPHVVEPANAMILLAKVRAGKVPDGLLEELP